jgi:6-phosphogluconate dehydrogenase (decarboxylating)
MILLRSSIFNRVKTVSDGHCSMRNTQPQQQYEIGMVGLGVMGRNLLLNMADHGFSVAGYDKDAAKVEALRQEAKEGDVRGATDIKEFIGLLRRPRAVMMLVPAGAPVDSVIKDLLPHLDKGDLIIDAGNSYFKDTDLRAGKLTAQGIHFLGVGVSGGEEGARHGPSIMPGGPKEVYERIRPIFEAASAKVNGDPCVTWLGPGSAGHFVKMVHNGIEYGVMQLIGETYDVMKRGWGMNDDEVGEVYASWNKGELNGYLVEITGHIFSKEGREDRQAADRRNPRRGETEGHRHVDLAERDGTASADPDNRSGGRDAGLVRVREGTGAGGRDLSAIHPALQRATATRSSAIGPRAFCRDDHHLCAGHGAFGGCFGQIQVSPRS